MIPVEPFHHKYNQLFNWILSPEKRNSKSTSSYSQTGKLTWAVETIVFAKVKLFSQHYTHEIEILISLINCENIHWGKSFVDNIEVSR